MTDKIEQIIHNYKNKSAGLGQVRADLTGLLDTDLKPVTQALLALFFNETYSELPADIKPDQDYFLVIVNGSVLNPGGELKKENILIYKDKIVATSSNMPDNLETT
ncbi:MAG TPA: hypothetical protein DDX14_10490, partial [Cyanobacteria bacterium UBA9579]|nr:hypothetical protein [Cyanobacteria bacterium UBA9579]